MTTFAKRVSAFLKLDDEGKISKFQKQTIKTWKEQITIRKNGIDELSERKKELLEEVTEETVLNVDMEQMKSIETRKVYIGMYMGELMKVDDQIRVVDSSIEDLEEEIKRFESMILLISDK